MPELIARPGIVVPTQIAADVVAELIRHPACPAGVWRVTTTRWELWGEASQHRLATVDVVHATPHPYSSTLTRVSLTETGQAAGLDPEAVCSLALQAAGVALDDCERTHSAPPPVFTGRRQTDRSAWSTTASPVSIPPPRRSPDGPPLDADDDRELRRLHYLASFGGLTGGLAARYAELLGRDRRAVVDPPPDDDLITVQRVTA